MNERIRQLAEQAKGFVDLNQHVGSEKGCMVYTYDGLEKFAELIVEECARVANDSNQSKNRAVGVSVGDVVRNHFGVE